MADRSDVIQLQIQDLCSELATAIRPFFLNGDLKRARVYYRYQKSWQTGRYSVLDDAKDQLIETLKITRKELKELLTADPEFWECLDEYIRITGARPRRIAIQLGYDPSYFKKRAKSKRTIALLKPQLKSFIQQSIQSIDDTLNTL